MPRDKNIQTRRGTAALWTSVNPILADGERGFETDTRKAKTGNGILSWTALSYEDADTLDGNDSLYFAAQTQLVGVARAAFTTGITTTADTFTLIALDVNTLRIAAIAGVYFEGLATASSLGIVSFPQTDVPLAAEPLGLGVDGNYIRYLSIDSTGARSYTANPTAGGSLKCQLGVLYIKRVAGVNSFIEAPGPNTLNVYDKPELANIGEFTLAMTAGMISSVGVTANANLTWGNATGTVDGLSVNWKQQVTPGPIVHQISVDAANPMQFARISPANNTGNVPATQTTVDPTVYWNGAALVSPGNNNSATVQRLVITTRGKFVMQYGEAAYANFTDAVDSISTAPFTPIFPEDFSTEVLRIAITKAATNLTDINTVRIVYAGQGGGGGSGSATTPSLQAVYNASGGSPLITTSAAIGPFSLKNGAALNTDNVLEIRNGAGTVTGAVTGNGAGTFASTLTAQADLVVGSDLTLSSSTGGGILYANSGTGLVVSSSTSATLRSFLSDEKGTGAAIFDSPTSMTLITPLLGTPTSGVLTNCTGTAAGLTAGNVTTNANLTGPITSVGNATTVAAQTGTGSTFVMQASPTLTTPNIGAATGTSLDLSAGTGGLSVAQNTRIYMGGPVTGPSIRVPTFVNGITMGGAVSDWMTFSNASILPATAGAVALGSSTVGFSSLYLDEAGASTETNQIVSPAVTGNQIQTLPSITSNLLGTAADGATTEVLVGGGTGALPVWTAALNIASVGATTPGTGKFTTLQRRGGTGTGYAGGSGTLYVNTTTVGNVGGGGSVLMTYDIPANTFATNGDWVRVRMALVTAANANNKSFTVRFGSTSVLSSGAMAANGMHVSIDCMFVRSGSNTQRSIISSTANNALWTPLASTGYTPLAKTDSAAITVDVTGLSGSSATNDCQQTMMIVEYGSAT